ERPHVHAAVRHLDELVRQHAGNLELARELHRAEVAHDRAVDHERGHASEGRVAAERLSRGGEHVGGRLEITADRNRRGCGKEREREYEAAHSVLPGTHTLIPNETAWQAV